MKKNIPSSPRLLEFKKKQQIARTRKIILFVFLLMLTLVGLSYLASWQRVNIKDITISGNKIIDTETIRGIAEGEMNGKYLWIIPKTNFLFYPKNKITNHLTDSFKRLSSISIDISDSNILDIKVSERTASFTWCGVSREMENNENQKCYFLDDSGYIFDEAPYFSGDVYFRFYGPNSSDTDQGTGAYFFQDNFKKLISFKDISTKIGLKPVAMQMANDGEGSLFLGGSKDISSPIIRFKIDSDFSKITENLQTALHTDPLKKKFNTKGSSLEYIDLRFGNKVYYKFKNEVAPVVPANSLNTQTQ